MRQRSKSVFALFLSGILLVFACVIALDAYPKFWQGNGFYLRVLKEHSGAEWHQMWQQLWDLSDSVTVPRSVVELYEGDVEAADKIIENIASYAFWVDDNGTDGAYKFKSDRLGLTVTGITYFPNAHEMQQEVDVQLLGLFDTIKDENKFRVMENIDRFLCANVAYGDEGSMQGQTLYSVLVEREALCGGFARATHILALMAGIDSTITVGYLSWGDFDYTRHAWNTYTIDNTVYFSDSTVNTTSLSNWAVNRPLDGEYDRHYTQAETHAEAVRLQ